MYFDAHSDIWTDVTVKRNMEKRMYLKNHHLDRFVPSGGRQHLRHLVERLTFRTMPSEPHRSSRPCLTKLLNVMRYRSYIQSLR